jgi:hypothetical protein
VNKLQGLLEIAIGVIAIGAFFTATAALFFNLPLAMAAALVAYAGRYFLAKV